MKAVRRAARRSSEVVIQPFTKLLRPVSQTYRCRLPEPPVTWLNVALEEICFDVVDEAFLWTTN